MSYTNMRIKNLKCQFHMPLKLKSKFVNKKEVSQSLPPFALVHANAVDEYPACPSNWMHGSDIASSYFLKVEEGKGMWLNFNDCFGHTHHVAVVISIQGVNPVTGQQTDKLRLEQYESKCPIHDEAFQQDRFCPSCKFKWPAQNYLTTTTTPNGLLWLDGFRVPGGSVRQYIFTAEKIKGIAEQLIGEDKVYAIGIAFYLSKEKKPVPKNVPNRSRFYSGGGIGGQSVGSTKIFHTSKGFASNSSSTTKLPSLLDYGDDKRACQLNTQNLKGDKTIGASITSKSGSFVSAGFEAMNDSINELNDLIEEYPCSDLHDVEDTGLADDPTVDLDEEISEEVKLEIGAGALIEQKVYPDNKPLDFWEAEPAGMIYINYCNKKQFEQIIKAGKREEKEEGFMQDLNVGG